LASIEEFRPHHKWLRWLKPAHLKMHYVYWSRRRKMAKSETDMRAYYKQARMPIARATWEYLKLRKSWFIVPLHWDRLAAADSTKILDAGCGDGDVTQRVAEAIEREWDAGRSPVHPIEIVGLDLSESRIENSKNLCKTKYKELTFNFQAQDLVTRIEYPDNYFDYSLCTGVLEILDDTAAHNLVANLCRVTKKAIYIEDLYDRFPGGHPREDMDALFKPYGFKVVERHFQLTEPFSLFKIPDPCSQDMSWPVQMDQVFWAERM
jgi:SAM-dependent methyltransferase